MSVTRSVSTSELMSELTNVNDTMTHIVLSHEPCSDTSGSGNETNSENTNMKEETTGTSDHFLTSKAQTLDRFSRPSSMNQHGEKRKKNFFASFRLSKKASGRTKDDQGSSGSDLSQTQEKTEQTFNKLDSKGNEAMNARQNEDSLTLSKPRKHYLNRMSSFVSRVANRVQGSEINTGYCLRNKLERSQTVTGTDLVSSKVDYLVFEENETPGLMGIRNHGNTCFINAVIQCLSHTNILAEYFVLDQYKSDLARCNRINSKKYGTRGEITEHLAVLLKSLWVLRYVPDISLNLKNIVEKYEPCYRGSNQHDAAEFLMFILDKVHEDLNTASKRKYKKVKNSYGRPDEIVAAETLANHLRCNSSFIQDIFQAQFRSSLKCPHCLKESNTFDPYLCVSIPIPQKEVLSIFVTVVYLNQQPKQVKIGVTIEASSPIKQLRSIISADCGICMDQLVLTEIDGEGFHRTFSDNACMNIIKSTDPIYAIELTPVNASMSDNNGFLHITWMNVLIAEPSNIRFGGVYQTQIARDVMYPDLQKLLLKEMSTIVTVETLISEQQNGIFIVGVDNGTSDITTLEPDLDHPLLHQCVDDSLSICHPLAGPPHVKLVLQWTQENKEKYVIDDVDHIEEHSSVEELKNGPPECAPVTLSDCLQLHTSAEMLSCGDAWHCPTCNRKQQVLKRLNLWSAPQVLVIHLKRFKQISLSSNSSKLNTVVNFPLCGFDISDHMAGRHHGSTSPSNASEGTAATKVLGGVWSPWKKSKKFNISENEHIYDLFAICNHHGRDLLGGHYTAVCRNPTNGKWYTFDDFNIEEISQEEVCGQDAYILFYQRREEPSSPCFTKDSELRHWSYRIPLSTLPSPLKIIPSEEDKKSIFCSEVIDTPAIEELKPIESSWNSSEVSDSNQSPMQLSPSMEVATSSVTEKTTCEMQESKDSTSVQNSPEKNGSSHMNVETVKAVVSVSEVDTPILEMTKMQDIKAHQPSAVTMLQVKQKEEEVSPTSPVSEKETSTNVRNDALVENEHTNSRHHHPISVSKKSDDEESIPEVRIQPASLEVLASHRYRSYPGACAGQSVIKVMLRPKSSQEVFINGDHCSSRSNRIATVTGEEGERLDREATHITSSKGKTKTQRVGDEQLTNGYASESSGRSSSLSVNEEETPLVRIRTTSSSSLHCHNNPHLPDSATATNNHGYRKCNSNKTPSFVVFRTPTSSPRLSGRGGGVGGEKLPITRNGHATTPTSNGSWRPKVKEMGPNPGGGSSSSRQTGTPAKETRPISYSGAGRSSSTSLNSGKRYPVKGESRLTSIQPKGHYEKTRSISCMRECEQKDNFNHFLTESSV